MDEFNATVLEQLTAQRDHDDVVALWEKIWTRFQRDGAVGVEELLEGLLERPETSKERSDR